MRLLDYFPVHQMLFLASVIKDIAVMQNFKMKEKRKNKRFFFKKQTTKTKLTKKTTFTDMAECNCHNCVTNHIHYEHKDNNISSDPNLI